MKGLDNEKELLDRMALGDQGAYKIVFSHYWDRLYAVGLMFSKSPEVAEDMTQDVFAHIWIKRHQLNEVKNFESWLFIITRNLFYDRLRKKTFSVEYNEIISEHITDDTASPQQQLELKEFEGIINEGIGHLPPQQQTAFRLSRLQGLSHEEIALQMGISRQSVKSYMVRSIVTLRKFMKQHTASLHSFFCLF